MEWLSVHLRAYMRAHRLNQRELAIRLGEDPSKVSRWLAGGAAKPETQRKIAKFLGLTAIPVGPPVLDNGGSSVKEDPPVELAYAEELADEVERLRRENEQLKTKLAKLQGMVGKIYGMLEE
jgi:transcriptional regulator with XRE-family HTH domain